MIQKRVCLVALLAVSQFSLPHYLEANATPTGQPYAGEENRQIKSLSEDDVRQLLEGQGWGLAKPAELNGFPGPAHVLEAQEELGLSPETKASIEEIYQEMNNEARRLGRLFIEAETQIEQAFASKGVSPTTLQGLLAEAEALRSQLRFVHLQAHIKTTPLLTRHQKMLYSRLRGYAAGDAHGHDHNHNH